MNILYLLNEFPKLSESFIINELSELERRGHNVTIIAFKKITDHIQHDELQNLDANVTYLPQPSLSSAVSVFNKHPSISTAIHQFQQIPPTKALGASYIGIYLNHYLNRLEHKPDIIHTHFFDWPKFALEHLSIDVPITVTAHAFGLFEQGTHKRRQRLAKQFDRIVTISDYNKRYLEETIGVTTPVDVVRMGIDPTKFNPTNATKPKRLLTVGRFVEKKGIRYAIDAVSTLVDEHPDLEYHIASDGPLRDKFEAQIRSNELTENIKLLGKISDEQLITELDEAAAFVLPCVVAKNGDRDGIPVALMEAMAMKAVPISTTVSGIPELVDNQQNGLLVEPKNTAQLSDAIERVCSSQTTQEQLATAARQRIETEYTIEKQGVGMEQVFTCLQQNQ